MIPSRARCFFQVVESEWLASCSPSRPANASDREEDGSNGRLNSMRVRFLITLQLQPLFPAPRRLATHVLCSSCASPPSSFMKLAARPSPSRSPSTKTFDDCTC